MTLDVRNKHCCIMFGIKQYQQRHTREGVERYREEGGHDFKMLHNDWSKITDVSKEYNSSRQRSAATRRLCLQVINEDGRSFFSETLITTYRIRSFSQMKHRTTNVAYRAIFFSKHIFQRTWPSR